MRLRTNVVGVLLAFALVIVSVGPAAAHDELVESSPSAGAVLASAPAEVRLTFSAEIMDAGAIVAVTDDRDESWTIGEPQVVENLVTVGIPDVLPDGGYVVLWRVVSSDGHPISGTFSFAVGSGEDAAAPGSSVGEEPDERGGDSDAQGAVDEPLPVVLVAIVSGSTIALVLGGSVFWYRRRRFRGVQ